MDHKAKPKKAENIVAGEPGLAKSAAWARVKHESGVDVWGSKPEAGPSRYKPEMLRNVQLHSNSLLDNYEIECIWKQLDYYVRSSHAKFHGGDPAADDRKKVGFWWKHVPVCSSSRDDVVERRPEKGGVPVVGAWGCRPRPPAAVRLLLMD